MLLAIAFAVTLITAFVCNLCGAERVTILLTAPFFGVLSAVGLSSVRKDNLIYYLNNHIITFLQK